MSKPISLRIFHFLAIGLLVTLLGGQLTAQPILLLNSQAEVDSVPILYPNLTEVYALSIGYLPQSTTLSDIHDLSPLSSIQRIVADISIRNNPHLTSLFGLHNIDSIFGNIYSRIENNDSLLDLSDLQVKHIGEELQIRDNDRLQSLTGLEGVTELNILGISGNPSLATLDGLTNLKKVKRRLSISSNAISNVVLPSLQYVGWLTLYNEPNLISLTGLSSVDSMGNFESIFIYDNGNISLFQLPVLASLQGIEGVHIAPGTNINIDNNPELKDVLFLEAATVDSLTNIRITDNPKLQYLSCPGLRRAKTLEIVNNAELYSISFPKLESLYRNLNSTGDGKLNILDNPSLMEISMPKLNRVDEASDSGTDVSFVIYNNDALESIGSWGDSMVVQGGIHIYDNASLKNLVGLEGLKSVGGSFIVENNPQLTSLCNFVQFDSIGAGLGISANSLVSLDGLQTLRYVGISVGCGNDSMLADVSALYNLDSVGLYHAMMEDPWEMAGISFGGTPLLKKIDFSSSNIWLHPRNRFGASNCPILDTLIYSFVGDTESFQIEYNSNLKYLSIPNIQAVGLGQFTYWPSYIRNNASLTTLDGISTITTIVHAPDSLVIRDNPQLTDCEAICRILDRGQTLPSRFHLGGNAFPCNSVEEVEEHICDTLTVANEPAAPAALPLLAMPNPTEGVCHIELPEGRSPASLRLYDAVGRNVFSLEFGYPATADFDIQDLPPGVFLIWATDRDGTTYLGKLMKR